MMDKITALREAAQQSSRAIWQVTNRGEQLGMNSARDVVPENALILTGHEHTGPGRANTFDLVALVLDRDAEILIVEAKGVGSKLGSRMADGLRVEQGTREYRDWMLRNDQDLRRAREELAAKNPELARAFDDAVAADRIRYVLVQADLARVQIAEFRLDSPRELSREAVQDRWRERGVEFLRQAESRFAERVDGQVEELSRAPEFPGQQEAVEKARVDAERYREMLRELQTRDPEKVAAVLAYYSRDSAARLVVEQPNRNPGGQLERPVPMIEVDRGPGLAPIRVPYDSPDRSQTYLAIRMWQGWDVRQLDVARTLDASTAVPVEAQRSPAMLEYIAERDRQRQLRQELEGRRRRAQEQDRGVERER
jgi:hypothetical protein